MFLGNQRLMKGDLPSVRGWEFSTNYGTIVVFKESSLQACNVTGKKGLDRDSGANIGGRHERRRKRITEIFTAAAGRPWRLGFVLVCGRRGCWNFPHESIILHHAILIVQ